MSTSRKKILIVEDDLNFGSILADFLRLHSFNVTLSKNGIDGSDGKNGLFFKGL